MSKLELRGNKLNGSDFGTLKGLYPNLYKIKVGANPISSLDVFKAFVIIIFNSRTEPKSPKLNSLTQKPLKSLDTEKTYSKC